MTSPKDTAPFHMLRMFSPYPAAALVAILAQVRGTVLAPRVLIQPGLPGKHRLTSSVDRILTFGNMFE
jgi:hypothetical protein